MFGFSEILMSFPFKFPPKRRFSPRFYAIFHKKACKTSSFADHQQGKIPVAAVHFPTNPAPGSAGSAMKSTCDPHNFAVAHIVCLPKMDEND